MNNNQVAIHENADSDKAVKFMPLSSFTQEFIKAFDNAYVDGVFYQDGGIAYRDIWGETHTGILA